MRVPTLARSNAARRHRLDRRLSVEDLEGRMLLNAADAIEEFMRSRALVVDRR